MPKKYIHFTSLRHARHIQASGELWESSFVSGVYAAEVGGEYVPGTQRTSHGRAENRDYAVLFSTEEKPHLRYPEEVVWHKKSIRIRVLECMRAKKAAKLLDGSTRIPDLAPKKMTRRTR